MDEVGSGFQPAGAFQASRCPLTGKVPTPRRSTAAAQKGWPHFFHEPLGHNTSSGVKTPGNCPLLMDVFC